MTRLVFFLNGSLLTALSLGLITAGVLHPQAPVLEITVSTGSHVRTDTPVSVVLPENFQTVTLMEITSIAGKEIPVQLEPGNPPRLHWILSGTTPAREVRTFRLTAEQPTLPPKSSVSVNPQLEVHFRGRPVLRYNSKPVSPPDKMAAVGARSAYIHPLWTPSGRIVTDDFPSDHPHQRGIFFAWTKTKFKGRRPDFWNLGGETGSVRFDRMENRQSGPVFGSFQVQHQHLDSSTFPQQNILKEQWKIQVFALGPDSKGHLFDLKSHQQCATTSPLELPQYRYGGFALRGSQEWRKNPVEFLTSEGKDRLTGDASRARWCAISGQVKGQAVTVIIFCHPDNYRAPQPLRIHPRDPYFNFSPVRIGPMKIEPGQPYVSQYRVLAADGKISDQEAQKLWQDYADPPQIQIRSWRP